MSSSDKQRFCSGCRDDFYNHRDTPGFDGATKCWMLKDAKIVKRWRIHWWTEPTRPGAFSEVETLNCHNEPGQFSFQEKLPEFAVNPRRLSR